MATIAFELDEFRAALGKMERENSAALAACAGHSFRPVNSVVLHGSYACRHCGGVIDHAAYVQHEGRA